jgi:hypothetical protein
MVSKAIHDGCSRLFEVIGVGVRTAQDDRPIHFRRIQGPVRDADNRVRQIEAICVGLLVSCNREPRSKLLARVWLNQAMQHLQRVVPRDLS